MVPNLYMEFGGWGWTNPFENICCLSNWIMKSQVGIGVKIINMWNHLAKILAIGWNILLVRSWWFRNPTRKPPVGWYFQPVVNTGITGAGFLNHHERLISMEHVGKYRSHGSYGLCNTKVQLPVVTSFFLTETWVIQQGFTPQKPKKKVSQEESNNSWRTTTICRQEHQTNTNVNMLISRSPPNSSISPSNQKIQIFWRHRYGLEKA